MKTVVIRFSALGDCILLCPFLEHLRGHGVSEITVVTKQAYAALFAAARGVDRVIALDPRAGWRGVRQIIQSLRGRDQIVIDAHNTLRSKMIAAGLGGAEETINKYYRRRLGLIMFKRHGAIPTMNERYGALGESLGVPPMTNTTGGIEIPSAARKRVDDRFGQLPDGAVAIAPGSRWATKRWGVDRYVELARRIVRQHGRPVIVVGDATDAADARRIVTEVGEGVTEVVGQTSVVEAAAVIEQTAAFIGNDSGLMHLAEAVGVPVIALFGPTVREFGYSPSLTGSQVIERELPCRPCSRNGSRPCPIGSRECLTGISVDTVEQAFMALMKPSGDRHIAS